MCFYARIEKQGNLINIEKMVFDIELIRKVYGSFAARVEQARKVKGTSLTLAEKILYAHLYDASDAKAFRRGVDYVNFRPDRVAMQDATAQMALLQFMNAGRDRSAVPASVHCDHLIQADRGPLPMCLPPTIRTARCTIFSKAWPIATGSVSGKPGPVSFIRSCWKTTLFRAA